MKYNLRIFETPYALSVAAANLIIKLADKSIKARGKFVISLSGGNSPEKLYSLLATPDFNDKMPWKNIFIFWGDERCVSLVDPQNNAHMAKSLLLDRVGIPPSNIYPVPVNLLPSEAAAQYNQTIKQFFGDDEPRFDLMLLGLGENGHTASLFPGTKVLLEKEPGVKEEFIDELKMFRITMTAPLINKARNIVFLVSGKAKAEIVYTMFTVPYQPDTYPAQMIKPENGELLWMVDNAAAALLPEDIKEKAQ